MLTRHRLRSTDGVALHVVAAGPPDAPAIVLVHGWSQHHLSWSKQLSSDLAQSYRMIAPDLRGHGASDKPDDPSAYDHSAPWAADMAAIIDQLGLDQPILLGWSMGGFVLFDYLRHHRDGAIGGLVLVGARVRIGAKADPAMLAQRKADVQALGAYSEDQAEQLKAIIAFLKACAAGPLSKTDLALMTGFNMLVPPHIRRACRERSEDWRADLGQLTKPALILQGRAERVCPKPFFEETAAAIPHAQTLIYPASGHLPFWEEPERFNADLAQFAARVFGDAP